MYYQLKQLKLDFTLLHIGGERETERREKIKNNLESHRPPAKGTIFLEAVQFPGTDSSFSKPPAYLLVVLTDRQTHVVVVFPFSPSIFIRQVFPTVYLS